MNPPGIFFGVVGGGPEASALFDRLQRASVESTPGILIATFSDGNLSLGHATRRFSRRDGRPTDPAIFIDGEIRSLDGADLTTSEPAPRLLDDLAAAYRVDPDRFWTRLDGSFCLVVRDGNAVSVGIDVTGTRSVYWWAGADGIVAIHSHLADLAASVPGALTEDAGAIGAFLACGNYPVGRTAFREIGHLGAGQYLRFGGGRPTVADHFPMIYEREPGRGDEDQEVDRLIDLISASVGQARRRADRPVVPLSGGLDSRYLAAELVRQTGDPQAIRTITWGEDRSRPRSDAQVAPRLAAALGVENAWFEKLQWPTAESFARAIYLSSGEADCAIHFADDDALHARLADELGFASLFRGDECFGAGPTLLTRSAVLAVNGIAHLGLDRGYDGLLDADLLRAAVAEQDAYLAALLDGLGSGSPTGARDEVSYALRLRRVLALYNRVKHAHLEVLTPYLARPVIESMRGVPDSLRAEKRLLRRALARRFPEIARIPFAVEDNLPRWEVRERRDPRLARFYREWFDRPGWLDGVGGTGGVIAALDRMEAAVATAAKGLEEDRPGRRSWRSLVKRTLPGRLLRELTLERRYAAANVPTYLRVGRLAVLHELLGAAMRRRAAAARNGA